MKYSIIYRRSHPYRQTVVVPEYLNRTEIVSTWIIRSISWQSSISGPSPWAITWHGCLKKTWQICCATILLLFLSPQIAQFRLITGWKLIWSAWTAIWGIRLPWLLNGRFWGLRKTIYKLMRRTEYQELAWVIKLTRKGKRPGCFGHWILEFIWPILRSGGACNLLFPVYQGLGPSYCLIGLIKLNCW